MSLNLRRNDQIITPNQMLLPRLTIFDDDNFRGRRRVYRGNVAVRDIERIFSEPDSLRFRTNRRGATLVIFARDNFKGNFTVFRTNRSIADFEQRFGFECSSFILSSIRLTLQQIRTIQSTGRLPERFRVL